MMASMVTHRHFKNNKVLKIHFWMYVFYPVEKKKKMAKRKSHIFFFLITLVKKTFFFPPRNKKVK